MGMGSDSRRILSTPGVERMRRESDPYIIQTSPRKSPSTKTSRSGVAIGAVPTIEAGTIISVSASAVNGSPAGTPVLESNRRARTILRNSLLGTVGR